MEMAATQAAMMIVLNIVLATTKEKNEA